jgi:hypothetical protein
MDVVIMYRNTNTCPICGSKRGKPKWHNQPEDGEWFQVNIWHNECGHIDTYRDCYFESEKIKATNKIFS